MKHLVIIPAAGQGARFHELGRQYPKCLLPYNGKPIISCLVEKIVNDLFPSEIRLIIKEEDAQQDLWNCVSDVVEISIIDPSLIQGPATTIFCGLVNAEMYDVVTIILSDMVLTEAFPLGALQASDVLYTYQNVENPSRWCMFSPDGTFHDKPTEKINGASALLGVYRFTDPAALKQAATESLLEAEKEKTETQISPILKKYQQISGVGFQTITVDPEMVVDLGTLDEYLIRKNRTKSRAFNTIEVSGETVTKGSTSNPQKLWSEYCWLSHPPEAYKYKVPRIYVASWKVGEESYTMEKIQGHNLRDLALYYDQSEETWRAIFTDVMKTLNLTRKSIIHNERATFWTGVRTRVTERTGGTEPRLYNRLRDSLAPFANETCPYHGDLHFANMFFSGKGSEVRVVDPRGEFYGHWIYDVAKLTHSVLGRYDYIDDDLYTLTDDGVTYYDRGQGMIESLFHEIVLGELTKGERQAVNDLTASLFFSLCPLHENEEHRRLFRLEGQRFLTKNPASLDPTTGKA